MAASIPVQIVLFVLAGFCAQLIDGALGMAYGVSSNALLLSLGVPPAIASANVHAAEVVTTAVSGIAHHRQGNVERGLFLRLLLPGVIGAALGAYLLSSLHGEVMRPYVAIYLLLMGLIIVWRGVRYQHSERERPISPAATIPLGLAGGFFDAVGGGGWGPIVTSTLVARGNHPRMVIGSVNAAEFFVTTAQVVVFVLTLFSDLVSSWAVILGLLVGGALAAPLAAVLVKRIPVKPLMILVGVLIIALNVRTLLLL